MSKDYYLGLDCGSGSVGYCCTDDTYRILTAHRKRAIGVRLFQPANTAEARRNFRTMRRRLDRRQYRICLLQELFEKELLQKDENFLTRLSESDRAGDEKRFLHPLFCDKDYTDKQFYKQYPTIYHLRAALAKENDITDIRLLYLAIHHIIKYRGNFLYGGSFDDCMNIESILIELRDAIEFRNENLQDGAEPLSAAVLKDPAALKAAAMKSMRSHDKLKLFSVLLNLDGRNQKEMVKAMIGNAFRLDNLFGKESYADSDLQKSITFDATYADSTESTLQSALTEFDFAIITALKKLYDWQVLTRILQGGNSLSESMIAKYETHKEHLFLLKSVFRRFGTESDYEAMFGDAIPVTEQSKNLMANPKSVNYTAYIGGGRIISTANGSAKSVKIASSGKAPIEYAAFASFAKKSLLSICTSDDPDCAKLLELLDNETLLPKINEKNNGLFPHQLNELELNAILQNAQKNFAFLSESSEDGTAAEKIKQLLTFRIPYFVGPLSDQHKTENGGHAWVVRKQSGRVTPWNINQKIDIRQSELQFIEQMTTGCTYLKQPKSLPRQSLLFTKFVALNELNKIRINGDLIPIPQKKLIYQNVYQNGKGKITKAKIERYLQELCGVDDLKISNYSGELLADMTPYRKIKTALGASAYKIDLPAAQRTLEQIIFYNTVHSGSTRAKDCILSELEENGIFDKAELSRLSRLSCTGWASMSKELLAGVDYNGLQLMERASGEIVNLIDVLYETQLNFMEITENKNYDFAEARMQYLTAHNILEPDSVTYKQVYDSYCSPSVKRTVWQTILIAKELMKEFNAPPKKVFIEVTRERNDPKKKGVVTPSREKILDAVYKDAQKAAMQLDEEKQLLAHFKTKLSDDHITDKLKSEKMYLYMLQLGKCMYTGTTITLDDLMQCDIDHIIPQSVKKDDSLDNKVLVLKSANAKKGDLYPIPEEYRRTALWKNYRKMRLISEEKYLRLTRKNLLTDAEKTAFIKRQLVETSQSVLLIRDFLVQLYRSRYPDKKVEIILSKAGNISDFRKDHSLTKSRDLNDFHHGADAYLNIVVGNVLNEKFNHNINLRDFQTETASDDSSMQSLNFKKVFWSSVYSYREKREVWQPKDTLPLVRKELEVPNYNTSAQLTVGKGELYNQTIYKAEKSSQDSDYPINEEKKNISLYGSYKTSGTAYFVVLEHELPATKNKPVLTQKTIQAVPIFYATRIAQGKMTIEDWARNILKLKNPKRVKIEGLPNSILLVRSLLKIDGVQVRLSGISGNRLCFHNANQLRATEFANRYVKEISVISEKIDSETRFIKKDSAESAAAQNAILAQLTEQNQKRLLDPNVHLKAKANILLLNVENNIQLYDFYLEKLTSKPFCNLFGYTELIKTVKEGRKYFAGYGVLQQIGILQELCNAFSCNARTPDLSALQCGVKDNSPVYGKGSAGNIKRSNNITNAEVVFISQSVTGLRNKEIVINKP